jgi:glyoxylase-like metal-dependent hydrolase (beta-lactamase superfamily II)
MKKTVRLALAAGSMASTLAWAQAPEVSVARIDCGTAAQPVNAALRWIDTFTPDQVNITFAYSCYLIKHGDDYMVWDTGYAPGSNPNAPKVGLAERLAEVHVKPEQVKYVGISHFHPDHTGQLSPLTHATLLIGKGDWDGINANPPMPGANVAGFKDWMGPAARKVEPLTLDKDVFGDGTVMVIRTPGHTSGHMSTLVRLRSGKNYLLTGDAAHFHENWDTNGVPGFNFDRAQTLASMDRLKKIAANLGATVIIPHDPRDVGKLPAWPAAAR